MEALSPAITFAIDGVSNFATFNNPAVLEDIERIEIVNINKHISIIFFFLQPFLINFVIKIDPIVAPIPAGTTTKRPTYETDTLKISSAILGSVVIIMVSPT